MTVSLVGDGNTSLSDENGNAVSFSTTDGTITVTSPVTVTPEPATIVSAGIAGLIGLGWSWRRRQAKLV